MFFKECGNVTFFILVTESVVARDLDHGGRVVHCVVLQLHIQSARQYRRVSICIGA